jgi:hypothetical protein
MNTYLNKSTIFGFITKPTTDSSNWIRVKVWPICKDRAVNLFLINWKQFDDYQTMSDIHSLFLSIILLFHRLLNSKQTYSSQVL